MPDLAQLDLPIREAILGNVSTLLAFRVGPADARVFAPLLGNGLTVEGMPMPAFSAEALRL